MAIEYDNDFNIMNMICDHCSHSEYFEGSWSECIDEAKANGWRIYKDHKVFAHKCPICIEMEDDE